MANTNSFNNVIGKCVANCVKKYIVQFISCVAEKTKMSETELTTMWDCVCDDFKLGTKKGDAKICEFIIKKGGVERKCKAKATSKVGDGKFCHRHAVNRSGSESESEGEQKTRCAAMLKGKNNEGKQCSRMAKGGKRYCATHEKTNKSDEESEVEEKTPTVSPQKLETKTSHPKDDAKTQTTSHPKDDAKTQTTSPPKDDAKTQTTSPPKQVETKSQLSQKSFPPTPSSQAIEESSKPTQPLNNWADAEDNDDQPILRSKKNKK
jgi:hypothetical protein